MTPLFFPGGLPTLSQVGGKALSLFRLLDEGLDVPHGAVLRTDFFAPWFASLQATPEWSALVQAAPADWAPICERLKTAARTLDVSPAQQAALDQLSDLDGEHFAVRSSSPEEDLVGASFAGGYESVLEVPAADLLAAVRVCFASALDARVLHYKRQQGFDPLRPRIAVIVQEQIPSEVAGVAFSLNPLNNDYDELLINAAPGLGEALVSGAVTPDEFVIDAVTGAVLRETPAGDACCLKPHQLSALHIATVRIQEVFGTPMDVEWAFAGGRLHILQARPITAWVPLPESMVTAPGARRRLYMDLGLGGGLTINAPISPIGQSWMERFAGVLVSSTLGALPWELGPLDQLWFLTGGRMYQDMSNVLCLATPKMLAMGQDEYDPLVGQTIRHIDRSAYKSERRPVWVSVRSVGLYLRAVWSLRGALLPTLRAAWDPRGAKPAFDAQITAFRDRLRDLNVSDLSLEDLIAAHSEETVQHVFEVTMPMLGIGLGSQAALKALVPARLAADADALTRGYEGNDVVEMGRALFEMRDDPTGQALAGFLHDYGWRGPHEVDLGRPRYADQPELAASQARSMQGSALDPVAAHAEQKKQRVEALERVLAQVGPLRRALIRWLALRAEVWVGTRDTPKHQYLMLFAALRRRALLEGRMFVDQGRLDDPEHVMDLTLDEIEHARTDQGLDLRALRAANRVFLDQLDRLVTAFPAIIDSRGRILRPPPTPHVDGELRGFPVSAGVHRGPVKVLRRPDDQPIEPGDVLVAHTTDPGWTPLFVNAGAVVLQVGGVLQHGAVVAREYGLPCVSGIFGVLDELEDGQMVEVDGTQGVVRIL